MKPPTKNPGPAPFPRAPESDAVGQYEHERARLFDEHGLAAEVEELFRRLLEASSRRHEESPHPPSPSPLPMQLILGSERLRLLVGDSSKITLTVAVPDRRRFDDIEFPGQIKTGCDRHGFRIKAFLDEEIQILAIHVDRPVSPQPAF